MRTEKEQCLGEDSVRRTEEGEVSGRERMMSMSGLVVGPMEKGRGLREAVSRE